MPSLYHGHADYISMVKISFWPVFCSRSRNSPRAEACQLGAPLGNLILLILYSWRPLINVRWKWDSKSITEDFSLGCQNNLQWLISLKSPLLEMVWIPFWSWGTDYNMFTIFLRNEKCSTALNTLDLETLWGVAARTRAVLVASSVSLWDAWLGFIYPSLFSFYPPCSTHTHTHTTHTPTLEKGGVETNKQKLFRGIISSRSHNNSMT